MAQLFASFVINWHAFPHNAVIPVEMQAFNRTMTYGIFDIVNRGEWTVDKMIEMVSAVAQDNGDQTWTGGEDTFGLMSSTYNSIGVITSMGIRLVGVDAATHTFSTSVDQILANNAVEAVDKAGELYALEGVYVGSYSLAKELVKEYAAVNEPYTGKWR